MEFIKLTDRTERWFLPLLSADMQERLRTDARVFALGAVQEQTACGVLVFRTGRLAEILYLAVSDTFRRRGVATGMVDYLCAHARATTTPVIARFSAPGPEDPVFRFFKSLAFFSTSQDEGYVCRVERPMLEAADWLARLRGRVHGVTPFFSLPRAEQRVFLARNSLEALAGGQSESLAAPLCLCCRGRDGISAAVFVERRGARDLYLSYAWCAPGGQNGLVGLLAEVCGRILSIVPEIGDVYIAAVTPTSVSIVEKLFPQRAITERFYCTAWDMDS